MPVAAMRLRAVVRRRALHGIERHGVPVEVNIGPMHRFRIAPVVGEDMHRRRVVILELSRRRLDEGELPAALPIGQVDIHADAACERRGDQFAEIGHYRNMLAHNIRSLIPKLTSDPFTLRSAAQAATVASGKRPRARLKSGATVSPQQKS